MEADTVFVITGPPRHGKSTFAEMLCHALSDDAGPGNTSDVIYTELAARRSISVEELRQLPKESLRPDLVALGDELCATDPFAIVRALIAKHRVITGVRRCEEFVSCPAPKVLVWLERKNGPQIADNTDYRLKTMADRVFLFEQDDFESMRAVALELAREK